MAIFKTGALITEMQGKVGGLTTKKDLNTITASTKVNAKSPFTGAQLLVRAAQSLVSRSWRELTQSQRDAWLKTTWQGKKGFSLFTACNRGRLYIGLAQIQTPPSFPAWFPVGISNISIAQQNQQAIFTATPFVAGANYILIIEASKASQKGFAASGFVPAFIATVPLTEATEVDFLAAYIVKWCTTGPAASRIRLRFKLAHVESGLSKVVYDSIYHVQAAPIFNPAMVSGMLYWFSPDQSIISEVAGEVDNITSIDGDPAYTNLQAFSGTYRATRVLDQGGRYWLQGKSPLGSDFRHTSFAIDTFTAFLVTKASAYPPAIGYLQFGSRTTACYLFSYKAPQNGIWWTADNESTAAQLPGAQLADGLYYVWCAQWNKGVANGCRLWLNNVLQAQGTKNLNHTMQTPYNGYSASYNFRNLVADAICYNRVLTDDERSNVFQWLVDYYSLA